MIDNPCKDCPDRHVNCHATCSKYTEWRKEFDAAKRNIMKQVDSDRQIIDFVRSKKYKK